MAEERDCGRSEEKKGKKGKKDRGIKTRREKGVGATDQLTDTAQ